MKRIKRIFSMFLCMVLIVGTMSGMGSLKNVKAAEASYGSGYVPTSGNQVTIGKAFSELPRTYEVTFNKTVASKRGAILANYSNDTDDYIGFEIGGSNELFFNTKINGTKYEFSFTSAKITDYIGEVVRLTLVIDDNHMRFYINGVEKQVRTTANSNGPKISAFLEAAKEIDFDNTFTVGQRPYSTKPYMFEGAIYDLSVWTDVRTPEEVACSYIGNVDTEDENLIAAYNFNTTENPSKDLSGNGYDLSGTLNMSASGVPVQGEYTTSSVKKGLTFERRTTYETDGTISKAPYTISSWVYLPSTYTSRGGVIFGNYKDSKTPCVSFEINANGVPRFYHINGDIKQVDLKFDEVTICDDEWVNLTFVVSGNTVSCYKNGVLAQDPITSTNNIDLASATNQYLLGGDLRQAVSGTSDNQTNRQYFKGNIIDVALYNEALSATDILAIYANGVEKVETQPFSCYELKVAEKNKDIPDLMNNNNLAAKVSYFTEKDAVTDYAYSFAVVGDTQNVTENDVKKEEENLSKIYDWILDNQEEKNIQYVFGLGDITDNNNDAEWTHAKKQISKLDGKISYSVVRGNHDVIGYGNKEDTNDYMTQYLGTEAYKSQFTDDGFYSEGNIWNSWRTFTVGEVDYLMLGLDYGPSDDVLDWAGKIIEEHPEHSVIITTHAYLYRDGTTLDDTEVCPPSKDGAYNDGDDMWDKLVSKYENIVLVMCGHDPSDNIMVSQDAGVHGNVVTSMLIDPQYVDRDDGSKGMLAMLYFSEDGKQVQVEYLSTVTGEYFKEENQFSFEMKIDDCDRVVKEYSAEEATAYIAGDNKYPELDGYLFAGWYTADACDESSLLNGATPSGTTYALFVPEHVLDVKAQISATLLDENATNDDTAAIRFVTTIDSLLYQQVGFEISYVDTNGVPKNITSVSGKVYERLYEVDSDSKVWTKTPGTTFCGLSAYFRACTLKAPSSYYNTKFTVKPFWITADGDKVYGVEAVKSISQGYAKDEVWVSDTGEDTFAHGTYENPYNTLDYALSCVKDGGTVHVKDKLTIPSDATWTAHDINVTITGNDMDTDAEVLDFSKLASGITTVDICINDGVTFSDIELTLSTEKENRIFAEGHKLVVASDVTFTNQDAKVQVLGGSKTTDVDSTHLELYTGNFKRIYGGAASKNVTGDTTIIVGSGVNAAADTSSHSTTYSLFGAGYSGTISGNTNVIIKEGAKFNHVYGGGESENAVVKGSTNVAFAGEAMSVYGGSKAGTNADTHVVMTGGKVEQIFGGSYQASMTGNTDVQVLGGTVSRRIYGGCYNEATESVEGLTSFSLTWSTENKVKGYTSVTIADDANLLFDYTKTFSKDIVITEIEVTTKLDNTLSALTRYQNALDGEKGVLIFNDDLYSENSDKIKFDCGNLNATSGAPTQFYNYLVKASVGGEVYSAGDSICIKPNTGNVATVTYVNADGETKQLHYTEEQVSYYPLPILDSETDTMEISVTFSSEKQTEFPAYEARIGTSYYWTEEEANIAAGKLGDATVELLTVYGTGYVPVSGQQVTTEFEGIPRTYEVTFKQSSLKHNPIFASYDSETGDFISFAVDANGKLYFNTKVDGTAIDFSFTSATAIPNDDTVRLTLVLDDTEMRYYINGVWAQTRTVANSGENNGNKMPISDFLTKIQATEFNTTWAVGQRVNPKGGYIVSNGAIYDLSVWSDVRTPDEVACSSIATLDTTDDNLIAAYDFRAGYHSLCEEAPFNQDLSGNEHNLSGTLNIGTSVSPVSGVYSTSSIAGTDGNYIGKEFTSILENKEVSASPHTVSAWVYYPSTTTGRGGVIWGNYEAKGKTCVSYEIYSGGNPRFFHTNSDGTDVSLIFTDVTVYTGEWTHIAFVTSGNTVSCYINGVLKQTKTSTTYIDLAAVSKTYVLGGDLRTNNAQYFKGSMLELAVYENALSASEIRKIYADGIGAISASYLAYYELKDEE